MAKLTVGFDNSRPDDDSYPTTESGENSPQWLHRRSQGGNIIVNIGDYVVNRDGDIMIASTSNSGPYSNGFLRDLNEGYFRARYIGNRDDSLEYANQSRLATNEEVARAKKYVRRSPRVMQGDQVALL